MKRYFKLSTSLILARPRLEDQEDKFAHVDLRATIHGEEIRERKKTHKFNMVRRITYVHGNREEDFHYISN